MISTAVIPIFKSKKNKTQHRPVRYLQLFLSIETHYYVVIKEKITFFHKDIARHIGHNKIQAIF